LAPAVAEAWHNLGKTCYELQRTEEAETCFRRALKLKPDYVNSLDGLGLINLNRCDYGLAVEYCKRALKIDPTTMDSEVNLGMSYLAMRKWEGWAGYNKNLGQNKDRKELAYGETPRWNGAKGKDVVCYGEQGIGDEISFASCIPDLIRDSKSVVIECDKRLKGLFQRSFGVEVHGTRYTDDRPWVDGRKFDGRVAVGQLPEFYRQADKDFPGTPYLIADPQMRLQWRALFDSLGPEPKVGIAWTGGRKHTSQHRRSVNLETLLPILRQKAHFVSLQYHDPSEEIEAFEERHGIKIHHWPHGVQSYDYDPTVALIAELDLVISVTTTVVHVAGALGKECWCLVPEKVMWRYGVEGSDFPWAKSVTLYRQKGREWPTGILAAKLKERC
jgi:tetratricopeptide (TPR) repeat protein